MNSIQQIIHYINHHPLASRHKLRAYSRFVFWQCSQLFSPGEKAVPFIHETKLLVKKGATGATGNIYSGLDEFNEMGFLLHLLKPGDLFYDIGANVGTYSILAAGCRKCRVLSFEPVPATFASLEKNIVVNHLENMITAYNIGMGNETGKLLFTTTHDTVNHVLSENSPVQHSTVEISIESFDKMASIEGVPILAKIDVEGFETNVVLGMKDSLLSRQLKAIIIELNGAGRLRYGYDESKIHELLLDHDFRPYDYNPFTRQLSPLDTFGLINTIYIRDVDAIKSRIAVSDNINIFSESF